MIQLRLRTEFTFGRTFASIDRVVARLKEMKCTAAGIVDTASTWGHTLWFDKLKEAGIQPLLGVELAVGEDERAMWFLARNEAGLREMYRAATLAYKQPLVLKFGPVPRLHASDVVRMSDNIIKFAGECLDEQLLAQVGAIIDTNPSSRILNMAKLNLAEKLGLRMVSTSDNAYVREEDKATFELISDRGLKPSPQHIIELSTGTVEQDIADLCKDLKLPKAPIIRVQGDLEALCREGIKFRSQQKRWSQEQWSPIYEERLQHELKLIREKEFDSYFLVVADMVRYAKEHMLVGPSRGSAAGSLVCYLTRITEIDPLEHKLFFERFIDITRQDLPDIDLDFPDDKRQMVFDYMAQKYGADNVAHIGTISRFQPKSALIQVCKKLRIPPQATGAVKAAMIVRSSADSRASNCLLDTLKDTEPGQQLVKMYPQVMMAADLEAHASHTGIHAAGLLVGNAQIQDFATIDEHGIAQITKESAEKLGLLKIDVLGLRTLGILEDSGIKADWYNMPFNDQKALDIFNRAQFCCIFQFEGSAMRSVGKQMQFTGLVEIDAVTALARPGPFGGGVTEHYLARYNKQEETSSIHPLVDAHMADTFGLPIYQEQTLAIVREIGKFDWKETSTIRKAMSKRMGREFFDTMLPRFIKGAAEQGIDEQEARATWNLINSSGAWAMNRAHTRSYAVISYWCAWLKAHHPLEFAAANLRNAKDEDTALFLLREMTKEGLKFKPFDPQLSEETWSIKDGTLVAGFDSLKGFGDAKAKEFVAARVAGHLTDEMVKKALAAQNIYSDIFPMQTKFGAFYTDPESVGVDGKVYKLEELDGTQEGSCCYIGRLVRKNPRNANEDVNVKKRGGKMLRGPLNYLDITVQDDTGFMNGRIDRFKYNAIGKHIVDNVALETPLLVRGRFVKGIRYAFIEKYKVLEEPK